MSVRLIEYAPRVRHARHCHDTTSITLIFGGALEEGTNQGTRRSGAFTVVVKPAGVYHENAFGPAGTRTFQLSLDAQQAADLCPNIAYGWHDGGPVARAMLTAFRASQEDGSSDAPDPETWAIDVLAACGGEPQERVSNQNRWLDDLAHSLDADQDQVSVRSLADAARMHPVSLARAFRRRHNCSITEYIRRRKIVRACSLMDHADSLADIAAQTGFSDQPHFTRAFKTETGTTPAAYRRLALNFAFGSNRSRQREFRRVS